MIKHFYSGSNRKNGNKLFNWQGKHRGLLGIRNNYSKNGNLVRNVKTIIINLNYKFPRTTITFSALSAPARYFNIISLKGKSNHLLCGTFVQFLTDLVWWKRDLLIAHNRARFWEHFIGTTSLWRKTILCRSLAAKHCTSISIRKSSK